MSFQIEQFYIEGLHDLKSFRIDFKDNTLVLVGENGVGKTTVLRLLYYMLSGQWTSLAQYKFNKLVITIDGRDTTLTYELLKKNTNAIDERFLNKVPLQVRLRLLDIMENKESQIPINELEMLCDKYDIPIHYILNQPELVKRPNQQRKELYSIFSSVNKILDSQILYLPTYRRIEQELNLIFKGIDEDDPRRSSRYRFIENPENKSFVELIEFGMKDVDKAIKDSLVRLKDFAREDLNTLTLGYLGDVVDQKYSQVDVAEIRKASERTIRTVLDRIHEKLLSDEQKQHLSTTISNVRLGKALNEHSKVICHYFLKLLNFQEELRKKESQISNFCTVCNQYLVDKQFMYDSNEFQLMIFAMQSKDWHKVELKQLSSGEKQIVSLFSHLYLSGAQRFFVLIDEPELSLSVPWQRKFLVDIRNGRFCSGLVAVTHSPFIYDNELKRYARGLGEFEEEI